MGPNSAERSAPPDKVARHDFHSPFLTNIPGIEESHSKLSQLLFKMF
jgi:hypothetical protein